MEFGMMINGMLHLSPRESLEAVREGAILVDVRPESLTWIKVFDVEGIIYCPHQEFSKHFDLIPQDKFVILADAVGLRSKECVEILMKNGYSRVANMAGGIADWEQDGLPLLKDKGRELNGPCLCMLRPKKR
jgi:rhodanese-related sulfurtransferase